MFDKGKTVIGLESGLLALVLAGCMSARPGEQIGYLREMAEDRAGPPWPGPLIRQEKGNLPALERLRHRGLVGSSAGSDAPPFLAFDGVHLTPAEEPANPLPDMRVPPEARVVSSPPLLSPQPAPLPGMPPLENRSRLAPQSETAPAEAPILRLPSLTPGGAVPADNAQSN